MRPRIRLVFGAAVGSALESTSAYVVKARISHLTQSKTAALERAPAAASADDADVPANELFGREIPKGQLLQGYIWELAFMEPSAIKKQA